jgi:hypothetical protein
MSDFLAYGDTPGTLSDRDRGGDQTVAAPTPSPTMPSVVGFVRLVGDAEILADRAQGGDDTIQTLGVTNVLVGDAQFMKDRAQGGDDALGGGGLNNTLYGDAVEMSGRTRGGDDVLDAPPPIGTRSASTSDLFGDAHTLSDRAEGGDDTLSGAIGFAGSTARLFGDSYELLDRAQGGDDQLVSRGSAPDEMWGDSSSVGPHATTGCDIFVFAPGNGRDLIHDFEQGKDRIDLTAFAGAGIDDFGALAPRILEQADGSLVILDVGSSGGNSVVVAGAFGLGADDFLFG